MVAEVRERGELRRRAVRAHAAEPGGAAEQRAGLALVDVAEFRDAKLFSLAFQIRDLPGDELQRAAGLRHFQHEVAVGVARPAFRQRGDLEGLREQRVAREHGDAFAEDFVVRWFAATEIVVVHRGQIVVDERVGVDTLDGARERQGVSLATAAGLRRRERERGPHAFAAGEERIAHRLVDGGWLGLLGREQGVERFVDGGAAGVEPSVQVESVLVTRSGARGGGRHGRRL